MLIDSEKLKKAIELRIPKDRIDSSYDEGKNDGLCFALDEIVRLEEKEKLDIHKTNQQFHFDEFRQPLGFETKK